VQLVPLVIKVVSSNPAHGEVYSIQRCVIKFVSDLRQQAGQWPVSPGTPVSSVNKTDSHEMTEILLKVAYNHDLTITNVSVPFDRMVFIHFQSLKY
jgi:hypothetical protein